MKKMLLLLIALAALPAIASAQDQPTEAPGKVKMEASHWRVSKKHADGGHTCHFFDHAEYIKKRGAVKAAAGTWPTPPSVFDHGARISYPMLLNDQLGCCFYSSICHHDQTLTGNVGPKQSQFDLKIFRQRYLSLSGGDNGLSDGDVQREWRDRYLADVTEAKAFDYFYIDVKNPQVLAAAIHAMGGIQFTFTVAPAWISNSDEGDVWEANTYRPNNNGHAVHLVGVDSKGYFKLITWGTYVWISPAAIKVCNPDGFVVSSVRWFDPKGYAPTGKHITEVSKILVAAGGKAFPASVISLFPPAGPTPPTPIPPTPTPVPVPGDKTIVEIVVKFADGTTQVLKAAPAPSPKGVEARVEDLEKGMSILTDAVLKLQDAINGPPPPKKPATPKKSTLLPTPDVIRREVVIESRPQSQYEYYQQVLRNLEGTSKP